ncbi:MAG: ABC-F type ribosomal protection protein [Hornefia sp.]|nr:ABC-F type ribosomal protection protein [Hornefia sp.]
MIILSATEITKAYGVDVILSKISFHVNEGDRVGIVGANGAGKTTLLNILAGRDSQESGSIFLSKDVTMGYLSQKDDFDPGGTVIQQVENIYRKFEKMEDEIHTLSDKVAGMAARGEAETAEYHRVFDRLTHLQDKFNNEGGFSYRSEMKGILSSMAFGEEYYDKEISTLSGGERTRLALACILMEHPDLLLLDEPTNHLDIGMLKWLEQFLKAYKGTVVMVSHDRYFLDQMTTRIFEVEGHRLSMYEGNYSRYAEKKKQKRAADLKAYGKQQEEIKRQEEMIRRFKSHGTEHLAKRAASREKRLAAMDLLDRPEDIQGKVKMKFHQDFESGKDVLLGEGLEKSFGLGNDRKELFHDVSFDIKRGERICIVGPNGTGKTTLLKIMMGKLKPNSGYIRRGHQVEFGYYDQRQEILTGSKSVMDEIHDSFRLYKDSEIRGLLGRFLFTKDQVFNLVDSLSGGERARLALLKLMMSGTNVLVLDEPTNHLDIDSKEVFEEALSQYPGTVVAVSHDRYFLNKIATRIFELNSDGITEFIGGYDYYEEKKASIESGKKYINTLKDEKTEELASRCENAICCEKLSAAEERARKKKKEAEERRTARERDRLEKTIAELEEKIEMLHGEMCREENLTNPQKLIELDEEVKSRQDELDFIYDKWINL